MKNMKKHIIILEAIIAAALLAPACYPEDAPGLKTEGLTISLFSDEPETKAYDPTFETAIDHFDFYFFDDEAGTQPIANLHDRATGSSTTLQTGKNQTYAALRKGGAYVYIIANYPGDHPTTTNMTLEELLALEVNYPILLGRETQTNSITGDPEETGVVTFNSNMVMDSYHKEDGVEKYTVKIPAPTAVNQAGSVDVGLSRLATKLKMVINVASSVTGSLGGETWTPVMSDLKAYYVNALNNKTTVSATPIERPADTTGFGYITYPTAYPVSISSYTGTTDPVFTYPQTWSESANSDPYFKIQMTWNSNLRGTSPFYYKVRVPRAAADGKCVLKRNTFYTVTVDLSVVDTENDYVELNGSYIVTPWIEGLPAGGDGLGAARFFNVPVLEYKMYSDTTLVIPVYSSSAVSAYFDEISYIHYGAASTTDPTTEYPYSFTYGEGDDDVLLPTDGVLSAARDINRYKLTVADNNKSVKFEHCLKKVYTERVIKLTIKNLDNRSQQVIIYQYPAIEVKKWATKNAFVNGWFGRASADVKDNYGQLLGVSYTPTTYGGLPNPAYHNTNNWNSSYYVNINDNAHYNLGTVYGSASSSVKVASIFMVEIKISAFEEGENKYDINYVNGANYNSATGTVQHREYRIGDPRVPASKYYTSSTLNIPRYLRTDATHRDNPDTPDVDESASAADTTDLWKDPIKILMADQGVDANEVIAPHFLVSSQFNVLNAALSHTNSARRAMTYQEDGYPAGRWRLPTEAEIAFIVARQKDGTIPWLYADTYYHCANGKMAYVDMTSGNANKPPIFCNHTSGYNRFIYDLWYWGDDPTETALRFHPETEMTPWELATDPETGKPNWKAHWKEYYHPNMHER